MYVSETDRKTYLASIKIHRFPKLSQTNEPTFT